MVSSFSETSSFCLWKEFCYIRKGQPFRQVYDVTFASKKWLHGFLLKHRRFTYSLWEVEGRKFPLPCLLPRSPGKSFDGGGGQREVVTSAWWEEWTGNRAHRHRGCKSSEATRQDFWNTCLGGAESSGDEHTWSHCTRVITEKCGNEQIHQCNPWKAF